MADQIPFLTARWTNLALITYAIDPAVLAPYIPPGCELDTVDGRAFVSLVAFDFLDTRVLGIKWPGFVNFPEINLRFYVRHRGQGNHPGRRGVAFIRELVPSRIISAIARLIYNEPYHAAPMRSQVKRDAGRISTRHVAVVAGREQTIHLSAADEPFLPSEDSREHFFKEHSWGFGTSRGGKLLTYEVQHPCWHVYRDPVIEQLNWDFVGLYGKQWAVLKEIKPMSLIFAAGSEVRVFPKRSGTQNG